jgi:hypothetical protein
MGIAASAQMLLNFYDFDVQKFNNQWFKERYGSSSTLIQQVYQKYFESFELSNKTGTPILMDGQTNSLAAGILSELQLQLTDSIKYQVLLKKKNQETEESKWIKSAIGDMLSGDLSHTALLERVVSQKKGLLEADSLAQMVEQSLFFKTDFVAHLKIILGLTAWLENSLKAKISAEKNDLVETKKYIRKGLEAFNLIKEGQQLKSQSEKWKNWYRGDKKMNLLSKEKLTEQVLEILKEK